MDLHAITSVRREWATRSKRPAAAALFQRLTAAEPDLAAVEATSLSELFAFLERSPKQCAVPRWDVTSALIRQFHADELVGLGLLAALVPGLVHLAQSMSWGHGGPWDDPENFASELMSTAWTVLASVGGQTISYPERRVIDRVRRLLSDQRSSARQREQHTAPLAALASRKTGWVADLEDAQPVSVLESLAAALRCVEGSLVPRDDVRLLFAQRVLGYSLVELAKLSGETPRALRHRSQRAEAALLAG